MAHNPPSFVRLARVAPLLVLLVLMSGHLQAQKKKADGRDQPAIIQPGAPGEPSRVISAKEASDLAGILYTEADVVFMQGMMMHHAQALEMTDLLATRTQSKDMRTLSKRIELSQKDEIQMMRQWLSSHDREASPATEHHGHGDHLMPGMLTAQQMSDLASASGVEFDRLFLESMMAHHRGALVMVDDLLEKPGAAQESTLFGFTSDVVADQSAEIDRMGSMLATLSGDPRVGLDAGFRNAGQSLWNLELVAALPKPTGFFAPDAPEGVPIPDERDADDEDDTPAVDQTEGAQSGDEAEAETPEEKKTRLAAEEKAREKAKERERSKRSAAILNFANSDIAFSDKTLFEGNFHGFNTYNIEDPRNPRLLASVVCPGGQGDVSVVGNLLIMSVEQTRGRLDCGLQGVAEPISKERFRGVRIFDISNLAMPQQVAAVQTCRGSHTHTVVTDPKGSGRFYVFGSGTSSVRDADELEGCSDAAPGEDENTALFSIDVIEVQVAAPQKAKIVNRPRIFSDPESGFIAGLWRGGTHGTGTQKTSETNQCHDITVFPELGLAAGACSGNGILLDISDPVHPKRLDQVLDAGFAYWHSATFNDDGTKVLFTDEWGGGMRPRCRATDPKQWGADAIFDIVDRKLEFRGYYKLPAAQTEYENCVAHNGSLIPVPGRDIMVQAWYQGGISVFDFTDSAKPFEIAFFDRGPIDAEQLMMGGHWSAYWYDGRIYGTEIARGLDVLQLLPSEHLTQNEINAASSLPAGVFNPQTQRRSTWPASPTLALAYLDQLERSNALSPSTASSVRESLQRAKAAMNSRRNPKVATELRALVEALGKEADPGGPRDTFRKRALIDVLRELAKR